MTTCANCGTARGPFVKHKLTRSRGTRAEYFGPLCVGTDPAIMREKFAGQKDPKIAACNRRRFVQDEHNNGRHVQPVGSCPHCAGVPA